MRHFASLRPFGHLPMVGWLPSLAHFSRDLTVPRHRPPTGRAAPEKGAASPYRCPPPGPPLAGRPASPRRQILGSRRNTASGPPSLSLVGPPPLPHARTPARLTPHRAAGHPTNQPTPGYPVLRSAGLFPYLFASGSVIQAPTASKLEQQFQPYRSQDAA